jgi:hypothetical protein
VQTDLIVYATVIAAGEALERASEEGMGHVRVILRSCYNHGEAHGSTIKITGSEKMLLEWKKGDRAYIFA